MAEIPLVVIDVQRGGPSTGQPTKVEQGDLMAAIFGSHGDAPKVVMAASSIEDCFYSVITARKIAETFNVVVVVLSDGWDRGQPEVLGEQMERLHRAAHKLIWVNPLKVTPGYAPLARGMAAALPHVDAFVEGHSIEAIEQLAREIADGLGRADQQQRVGGAQVAQVGYGLDALVEREVGQINGIAALPGNGAGDRGIA